MIARTRGRPILSGVLAVVIVALSHATASASTVSVVKDPEDGGFHAVSYVAAKGERNVASFVALSDRRMKVSDPGAVISARGGCRSVGPHDAVCRAEDLFGARV